MYTKFSLGYEIQDDLPRAPKLVPRVLRVLVINGFHTIIQSVVRSISFIIYLLIYYLFIYFIKKLRQYL